MKKKLLLLGFVIFILVSVLVDFWPTINGLSGTLELTEHSLGARVPAGCRGSLVEESQTVAKGQLVAQLDRYDQAKRDFDRVTQLYQDGGATKQSLEEAQLALEDQEILSPLTAWYF